jgi:hypothetical protein
MFLAQGLPFCGLLWLCASMGAQAAVQISAETQIRFLYEYDKNKLKPGAEDIVITNHLDLSSKFANEFRSFDGVTSIRVFTLSILPLVYVIPSCVSSFSMHMFEQH